MKEEIKVISKEGETARRAIIEKLQPLFDAAKRDLEAAVEPDRWEVTIESHTDPYRAAHSMRLEARCVRECCDDCPIEEQHELTVSAETHFLDTDHPLTYISSSAWGFSHEVYLAIESGLGEYASERLSFDDPKITDEVLARIPVLLKVLKQADAISEEPWYDRE